MRYWHPFTAEAVEQLRAANCDEVVLLPLYPQYSSTTTGSSLNEWRRLFRDDLPVQTIETFYRHPLYLDALVEKIDEALARFPESGLPGDRIQRAQRAGIGHRKGRSLPAPD